MPGAGDRNGGIDEDTILLSGQRRGGQVNIQATGSRRGGCVQSYCPAYGRPIGTDERDGRWVGAGALRLGYSGYGAAAQSSGNETEKFSSHSFLWELCLSVHQRLSLSNSSANQR